MYSKEISKEAAKQLAESISTPDGLRTLRLIIGQSSTCNQSDSAEVFRNILTDSASALGKDGKLRIGIWEQQEPGPNTELIRKNNIDLVELWSGAESIPPKIPNRKRVILLGESVARGFFHDPHFNPAIALQRMLSHGLGEEVEVIDLARIDILMLPLLKLIKASLLLNPDILVVFAGNNWHPSWGIRGGRLLETGSGLRKSRDCRGIKKVADEALSRHLHFFTDTLRSILRGSGVPLLFLIPEFNLGDWRDVCTAPPLLSPAATARWLEAKAESEYALNRKNIDLAFSIGKKILEIDGGATPVGHYVMADASLLSDRVHEARLYIRQSREVALHWPHSFAPTIYSAIHRHLLESADACGFTVIDLQHHLQEYCHNKLPGRRVFADYCHLTEEGTRITMGHAAQKLLPMLGGTPRSWEELSSVKLPISAECSAGAHFAAAVFNANAGQHPEIVQYHLSEAIRHSPIAARLLSLFADFHLRRQPALVCASLEELLQTCRLTSFHLVFGFTREPEQKEINLNLIRECNSAMTVVSPEFEEQVDSLLLEEHGIWSNIDLLDTAYAPECYFHWVYGSRIGYYRGFAPRSKFTLIRKDPISIRLDITYRTHSCDSQHNITVNVNGIHLANLPTSSNWRSEFLVIPVDALKRGVNEIMIVWPPPNWDHDRWIDEVCDLFEANIIPDIRPVFGHIHSFRALAQVLTHDRIDILES